MSVAYPTEYRLKLNDEEFESIIDRYKVTILPAIFALDRLLSQRYDRAPYLSPDGAAQEEPITLLARDIAIVLGGGEPDSSDPGQDLVRFVSLQAALVSLLSNYRKIDSW